MPVGYKSGGTDFDDLFDPYVEGAKPGLTGYVAAGQDLRDRYAPISYGSKRADVGYKSGGADVSNLWAAKGTAVYQSALTVTGHSVFLPEGWTGPSGMAYPCTFWNNGQMQSQDALYPWTSDGQAPRRGYEIRVLNVSWEYFDAGWQFYNDAASWIVLNASTSAQICRFVYNRTDTNGGPRASGTCQVQIRDAATGAIVQDWIFGLDAHAGSFVL